MLLPTMFLLPLFFTNLFTLTLSQSLPLNITAQVLAHPRPHDAIEAARAAFIANMTAAEHQEAASYLTNLTQDEQAHVARSAGSGQKSYAGVYICSKQSWGGTCGWTLALNSKCYKFPEYGYWASFGPDKNLKCVIYEGLECAGTVIHPVTWPGMWSVAYVASEGERLGLDPTGYKCSPCTNCENEQPTITELDVGL